MLRISQLKLKIEHTKEQLYQKTAQTLKVSETAIKKIEIVKQSLDARQKPNLFYVYTIDVELSQEKSVLQKLNKKKKNDNIKLVEPATYQFPEAGSGSLHTRPVIIGCGPAGLFCGYLLAEHGYRPILIERGEAVEDRQKEVEEFWKTGVLNTESNVQFGEGGAGTFSDGKLNTLVKDPAMRIRKVLEIFVENGASEEILYVNKPHIGTDVLCTVIKNMRERMLSWGAEVRFHTKMETLLVDEGQVKGILVKDQHSGQNYEILSEHVILAPGHSARDTFYKLYDQGVSMEAKSFAVGFRMEHPQKLINHSQYGGDFEEILPSAAYKLTAKLSNERGIYSFCMCPGGYVVNASSEKEMLAVNGMSYQKRDSKNANSAIIVTIDPSDFSNDSPLAGIEYQRNLEKKAFLLGNGKIPVQAYKEFYQKVSGEVYQKEYSPMIESFFSGHAPVMKGAFQEAELNELFPEYINESIVEGMENFDRKIKGFAHPETILSGVESRTSSPVRIVRNERMQSNLAGLYPCGEGAGYAGGITSAAVDGIKIAEEIRKTYGQLKVE